MSKRHLTDEELQSYLDQDLGGNREWIQAHLEICEQCREKLAQYQQLYSELDKDVGFELSPKFAESVISRISEPAAVAKGRYLNLLTSIFGLIAGLGVLLYFTDLKPLKEVFGDIYGGLTSMVVSIFSGLANLLSALNVDTHLLVYAAMVLALTLIFDYLVLHKKMPVLRTK